MTIQHLKTTPSKIKLKWLNKKYIPKLNWYLSLLSLKDWMYAIAGGALPGMTPGFIKAISSKQKTDLNTSNIHLITQTQVQGISEMLSLFIVLLGIGNSRTSLSAEAYALLPQASPVIAIAVIFLVELLIQLVVAIAPAFVELLNQYKPNTLWHVLIPNVSLLTIALGPAVTIPGILTSIAIGLLHKKLELESSQLVTVLSLPTLLVLSPINSTLVNLVF
jgi:TctA family transporter